MVAYGPERLPGESDRDYWYRRGREDEQDKARRVAALKRAQEREAEHRAAARAEPWRYAPTEGARGGRIRFITACCGDPVLLTAPAPRDWSSDDDPEDDPMARQWVMCVRCRGLLEVVVSQEPDESGEDQVFWGVRMRLTGRVQRSTGQSRPRRRGWASAYTSSSSRQ